MAKVQFWRKGHIIYQADDRGAILKDEKGNPTIFEDCKSINAAKRKSRELQKANGGLASGVLRLVPA